MASKKTLLKLQCAECERINYYRKRSVKQKASSDRQKLEFKKFCKWCKKHTLHKERKR